MTHSMLFRRLFLLLMIMGIAVTACTPTVEPTADSGDIPIIELTDEPEPTADSEEPPAVDGYPDPNEETVYQPYPDPKPEDDADDLIVGDEDNLYVLAEGETVTVSSGEALTFVAVEDSRCPADATCVQAGSLIVELAVTAADDTAETIQLSLDDPQITAVALLPSGFPITLVDDGTQEVDQGNERMIQVVVGHVAADAPDQDDGAVDNAGVVETIDILLLESFPLRAMALVTGYFPNGCWSLAEVAVTQTEETVFEVNVHGRHSGAEVCTEALVPFEETAEIPINQLPAGTYIVEAGEQTATFELQVDNMLEMPDEKPNIQIGQADVTGASVAVNEAAGVAEVTVIGYLRDGCTNINEIVVGEPVDNVLPIAVTTTRDSNMMCTMALVDYEETIEIPLEGLDFENLTLNINGFIVTTE